MHASRTPAAPRPLPAAAYAALRPLPVAAYAALGVIAFAYILLLSAGARTGAWLVAPTGGPARTDFAEFWGAGRLALEGRPAAAYDWPALKLRLELAMGAPWSGPPYPFFYPPTLLLLIAPMAALGAGVGAALWVSVGAAAALAALWLARRRVDCVVLLAAAPATFFCLCVGQTALLTSGLLLAGLLLLDRRPNLSGVLFALLAFKPQFGPLLIVALVAGGRWRAIAAAALTLAALILASVLAFGPATWIAFLNANAGFSALSTLPMEKNQSLFGLMRYLGAGEPGAALAQGVLDLGLVAWGARLWRSRASLTDKAAFVMLGTFLLTPYACVYDLCLTTGAVALVLPAAQTDRVTAFCLAAGCTLPLLALARILPYGAPSAFLILAAFARTQAISTNAWRLGDLSAAAR